MIWLALWAMLAYALILAGMLGLDALADIIAAPRGARRCPARFDRYRCRGVRGHVDRWHECNHYWWSP